MIEEIQIHELNEIDGGYWQVLGIGVGVYRDLLKKIEENPQDYTWTMDWYYS